MGLCGCEFNWFPYASNQVESVKGFRVLPTAAGRAEEAGGDAVGDGTREALLQEAPRRNRPNG